MASLDDGLTFAASWSEDRPVAAVREGSTAVDYLSLDDAVLRAMRYGTRSPFNQAAYAEYLRRELAAGHSVFGMRLVRKP